MRLALALSMIAVAGPALAHGGAEASGAPRNLAIVASLAFAVIVYGLGLRNLWSRAGGGRGIGASRVAAFAAGLALAGGLLLSPLDGWAERLLAVHMAQHFALMLIAAPLLVLGRPGIVMLWALPADARARLGRSLPGLAGGAWGRVTHPFSAWLIFLVALWAWHVPALHQRAIAYEWLHALQHASFLGAALVFWTMIFARPSLAAFLAVFGTAVQSCALAALMTTSGSVWYPAYGGTAGLSAIEDQQLAGLIMWVPCCIVMIGAGLALLFRVLRGLEARRGRVVP